jgi:hypothetical protein
MPMRAQRRAPASGPRRSLCALGLTVALALVASACGSTVSVSEQRRVLTNSGEEGQTASDLGLPGEDAADAGSTPTGAIGGAGTSAGGSRASGGVVKSATGATVVTEKEVKVGFVYIEDPGTANAAAGFVGIGQVNQRRAYDIMIADLNKTGVAGRKVVPVYKTYTTEEAQAKGPDVVNQELCAYFGKEKPVFAAFIGGEDNLRQCFTKAKIPQISSGSGLSYSKTFKDYPYLVETSVPALDRMSAFYIDNLANRNFFKEFKADVGSPPHPTNQPQIALLRYDEVEYREGANAVKKELASRGLSLCQGCEFAITRGETTEDALGESNQIKVAVDACKDRCTHILILDSLAGVRLTIFWIQQAENQVYRPRLGITSLSAPALVANLLGQPAKNQFRMGQLVGWFPFADVELETEEHQRCKKLFTDGGETFFPNDPGDPTKNKEAQADSYCDEAWYFRAAGNKGGFTQGAESWLNGVNNVGRVPLAGTFIAETRADRHDGVGGIRVGEYQDAPNCNACFRYVTPVIPV